MKVSGKSDGGDFKILDTGTHAAVCTQIIGVGMQKTEYQGVESEKEKLKIRFEVPTERVQWTDSEGNAGEGPMVIWSTYTASLHENAKLRAHLTAWRGKEFTEQELVGFELDTILGKPCMLSVVHREYNGKTYANIDSISKLMKGIDPPQAEGELISFDPYAHSEAELDKLPNWLKELVNKGKALREEQRARVRLTAEQEIAKMGEDMKKGPSTFTTDTGEFDEDNIPF